MTRSSTTGFGSRGPGGPKIVHPSNGKWQELYGHWCHTLEEAEAYAREFGMQVAYDGEELPPCPPPAPEPEPLVISDATRAILKSIVEKR